MYTDFGVGLISTPKTWTYSWYYAAIFTPMKLLTLKISSFALLTELSYYQSIMMMLEIMQTIFTSYLNFMKYLAFHGALSYPSPDEPYLHCHDCNGCRRRRFSLCLYRHPKQNQKQAACMCYPRANLVKCTHSTIKKNKNKNNKAHQKGYHFFITVKNHAFVLGV